MWATHQALVDDRLPDDEFDDDEQQEEDRRGAAHEPEALGRGGELRLVLLRDGVLDQPDALAAHGHVLRPRDVRVQEPVHRPAELGMRKYSYFLSINYTKPISRKCFIANFSLVLTCSHLLLALRSSQRGHPQSRSLLSNRIHRNVCMLIVSVRS